MQNKNEMCHGVDDFLVYVVVSDRISFDINPF